MNEKELILDLGFKRRGEDINESYLKALGTVAQMALERMFQGDQASLKLTGTNSEINSFVAALQAEKRYLDSFIKNGLSNSATYTSKNRLNSAITDFESTTGLRWPFI